MTIKVLGTGCNKCAKTFEAVQQAISEIGKGIKAEKIEDMEEIMKYDVISVPAVIINEKVITTGRALKTKEVIKLISDNENNIENVLPVVEDCGCGCGCK